MDVGCGPGTITADLAGLVAPGRVTAVEVNEAALSLAQETINQANVSFAVADVHTLGFADDSFDIVHAHQVLQHVTDPVRALGEMKRVCRPGGLVAVRDSDYAGFAWYPENADLDLWLTLYQRIASGNGGEPQAGRRLLSWAHAAGFTDVTATSSTWCFATAEERAWWGEMWAERVVSSAIAEQIGEDATRLAEGWRAWAHAGNGWFSVLHGEILCRV